MKERRSHFLFTPPSARISTNMYLTGRGGNSVELKAKHYCTWLVTLFSRHNEAFSVDWIFRAQRVARLDRARQIARCAQYSNVGHGSPGFYYSACFWCLMHAGIFRSFVSYVISTFSLTSLCSCAADAFSRDTNARPCWAWTRSKTGGLGQQRMWRYGVWKKDSFAPPVFNVKCDTYDASCFRTITTAGAYFEDTVFIRSQMFSCDDQKHGRNTIV